MAAKQPAISANGYTYYSIFARYCVTFGEMLMMIGRQKLEFVAIVLFSFHCCLDGDFLSKLHKK